MVPKVASSVSFLYIYLVLQDRLLYFLLRKSKHLELQSTKYHLNFIFGAWTLKQKNRVANLILEETYTRWGNKNDAPFEAELIQSSSSSATACLWTIIFFSSSTFFSFSSQPIAESLYSCHLFTMSKMATAAVVAWFYELNSNKQRELMARGVEQSEKGNCYKRRQLVYSIYNILW